MKLTFCNVSTDDSLKCSCAGRVGFSAMKRQISLPVLLIDQNFINDRNMTQSSS
jgi:hypothetical protein